MWPSVAVRAGKVRGGSGEVGIEGDVTGDYKKKRRTPRESLKTWGRGGTSCMM